LAVFSGIALLLFLEDFVAETFLATFTFALARPLVALRLAGAAFLVVLEALFLRVFCDTACARNCHAPVRCFYGNPPGPQDTHGRDRLVCGQYSTFSAKINDLRPIPVVNGAYLPISKVLGLNRRTLFGPNRPNRVVFG
jgi:hypothetical protein